MPAQRGLTGMRCREEGKIGGWGELLAAEIAG